MHNSPISLLLATDYPILRDALRVILADTKDLQLVNCIETSEEIVSCTRELRPDIVILDVAFLPELPEIITETVQHNSKVLLIGRKMESEEIIAALSVGASGVIDRKSSPDLLRKAIRAVMSGELWVPRQVISCLIERLRAGVPAPESGNRERLKRKQSPEPRERAIRSAAATGRANRFSLTGRELEVIAALVKGQPNKDIAATLGLSEHTVKHHLTNVFDKVGVYNRLELVVFAIDHGLCAVEKEPDAVAPTVAPAEFEAVYPMAPYL